MSGCEPVRVADQLFAAKGRACMDRNRAYRPANEASLPIAGQSNRVVVQFEKLHHYQYQRLAIRERIAGL